LEKIFFIAREAGELRREEKRVDQTQQMF